MTEVLIRLALVHALDRNREQHEAMAQLERTTVLAQRTGSAYFFFLCRLSQSHFALAEHRRDTALEALSEALAVGRVNNFATLSYLWLPESVARLCAKALEAGIEIDYVRSLIRKLGLVPPPFLPVPEGWPWPFDCTTFGGFHLLVEGRPLSFAGKPQKKPLDLLKAIVASGRREADEQWVCPGALARCRRRPVQALPRYHPPSPAQTPRQRPGGAAR